MTSEKLLQVIAFYRRHFESRGIAKKSCVHEVPLESLAAGLEHCHGMLDTMEQFVAHGEVGKAFRWLGFIQGCLWTAREFTLLELRDHSRS